MDAGPQAGRVCHRNAGCSQSLDSLRKSQLLLQTPPYPHADKVIQETLKYVNLTDYWQEEIQRFSLGMKQRLGIAIALLSKARFDDSRRTDQRFRPSRY